MPTLTDIANKQKRATDNRKPVTKGRKPATRVASSDIPWQKISDLYNSGKSTAEISDTLKLTRPKTGKGKENPYPYYLTVGYLTKLSHGVTVGDKTIKINRNGKRKKAAQKAA